MSIKNLLSALALACAAAGCSVLPPAPPAPVAYDFGLAPAQPAPAGAPASVQVSAPPWLDGPAMLYRPAWRDGAQLSTYRDSRWAAPPAALLEERLKQRLARGSGPAGTATLRVVVEEFCQVFDSPTTSRAVVRLRATLVEAGSGRVLRQQAYAEEVAGAGADARSGAQVLARTADVLLSKVVDWSAAAP